MMSHSSVRADLSALEILSQQYRDISIQNKSLAILDSKANSLLNRPLDRYIEREAIEELIRLKDISAILHWTRRTLFVDTGIQISDEQHINERRNSEALLSSSSSWMSSSIIPLAVDPSDFNLIIIARIAMEEILRLIPSRENNNDIDAIFALVKDIFDHFIDEGDIVTVGLEVLSAIAQPLRSQKYTLFHLIVRIIRYYSTKDDKTKRKAYVVIPSCDKIGEDDNSTSQQLPDSNLNVEESMQKNEKIKEPTTESFPVTSLPENGIRRVVLSSSSDNLILQDYFRNEKKPWRGTKGKLGAKLNANAMETKRNDLMTQYSLRHSELQSNQSTDDAVQTHPNNERSDDNKSTEILNSYRNIETINKGVLSQTPRESVVDLEEVSKVNPLKRDDETVLSLALASLLRIIGSNQRNKEILVQMKVPDDLASIAISRFQNWPRAMEYFVLIIDSIFSWDNRPDLYIDDSWDEDYLVEVVQVN